MLGAVHEYPFLIREQHLDTFGHVNNARYLEILEEVMRRRIGPTILEINMKFQRELRNRQRITIRSWTESYVGKIGKFVQQILDADGNLCCETLFTIALFDLNARKLIVPTPEWTKAIGLSEADLAPPAAR